MAVNDALRPLQDLVKGNKLSDEIHRLEGRLCRSILVGRLQGKGNLAGGAKCKTENGYCWAGDVAAEPFPFISFVSLTSHPGVQGEPVDLGHPFQSGIRSVQGPDGADHERVLSLLWADGYAVGYGTAEYLGHGIGVVCGFEFQPSALGILLQQAQPFQATACTLANQVNQILQLTSIRRPDPLKSGRPVIATAVYAIQEQDVKM